MSESNSAFKDTVLVVEDNADDIVLFEKACAKAHTTFIRHIVGTGGHAIGYLSGVGKYADRSVYPMPGLIILDLKLPDISGFEVLRWIRLEPTVARLPVIIFSGSAFQTDITQAYAAQADAYIAKPLEVSTFVEIVRALEDVWLKHHHEIRHAS